MNLVELDPKRFMGLVLISINNELVKYKDVELAEFIRVFVCKFVLLFLQIVFV